MPRQPKKLNIACTNKNCRAYNRVKLGNIILYGHKMNGTRNYKCTECGRQFVRTKGTPFYWRKLPKKEVIRICKLFVEKLSFRAIARATLKPGKGKIKVNNMSLDNYSSKLLRMKIRLNSEWYL